MNRILILFAHPRFENSRINRALLNYAVQIPEVTLRDLYELYPDFNIDVKREQELLVNHEVIMWHHPFYMYGAPALLKQWVDMVLEYGWAHGEGGDFLKEKIVFNTLTTGGSREAYTPSGTGRFTIGDFLLPFNQTATLCKMIYLPPFAVQGTYRLTEEGLEGYALLYCNLLKRLAKDEFNAGSMKRFSFLNDWINHEMGVTGA